MRAPSSVLPLRFDGVGLAVAGRDLVAGLDLEFAAHSTTVMLGPNGAGKSVLLRLAHGLLAPTCGAVRWSGDEGRVAGVKRHAMVFQKPVMLARSAVANLRHAVAAAGHGWRAAHDRAEAALARFDLGDLAERPARLLSGGEQQRLAIARAWALDPEVLFLDEPTSQLDPHVTRVIEAMLRDLAAEGRTLVMATHDLGQARRLADRILFLAGGRLVEDRPATDFFAHPSTREAAAFLAGDLVD